MSAPRTGVAGFFNAVDGPNTRMVQTGENLRFPLEPCEAITISRELLRQDLECHLPVQLGISGLIHLAHGLNYSEQTGGFTILRIEKSEPLSLVALVEEKNSDTMFRLELSVNPDEPPNASTLRGFTFKTDSWSVP